MALVELGDTGRVDNVSGWSDERFVGVRTGEMVFAGKEFEVCSFVACDLTEESFRNSRFYDCRFEQCEMALVDLVGASLRSVVLENCRLSGVNFSQLHRDPLGVEATFVGCDLSFTLFRGLDLTRFGFEDCRLASAEFAGCKLAEVSFTGSDLGGCNFDDCDLTDADLRRARNYVVSPFSNRIRGMRVTMPEAIGLLASLEVVIE